jgi:hypothetical protein
MFEQSRVRIRKTEPD